MRGQVPCLLLVVAAVACSKSSGSAPPDGSAAEPFARAVASLKIEHPKTLPELGHAVGATAVVCELRNATCSCTWRFVTSDGVKEIAVDAAFPDARAGESATVPMVARGGLTVELAPEEAERGYRAGEYNAPPGQRLPVSTAAGENITVASEGLTEFLNGGGHLVSPRAVKAAELEKMYASWTGSERLDACSSKAARVLRVKLPGETVDW